MEVKKDSKYWILEFLDEDDSKWVEVINYSLLLATHIEFNILYSGKELDEFQKQYSNSIVGVYDKKVKLYSSGKVLRLRLTNKVKMFLRRMRFQDFINWTLEDPSFYLNENEFIATISHEDHIYLNSEIVDFNKFKKFNLKYKFQEMEKVGFWDKIWNLIINIKTVGKF